MEEGGETVFPNAETKVTGPEWSTCAKAGLAVKTRKGDALLFFRSVPSSHECVSCLRQTLTGLNVDSAVPASRHLPACCAVLSFKQIYCFIQTSAPVMSGLHSFALLLPIVIPH